MRLVDTALQGEAFWAVARLSQQDQLDLAEALIGKVMEAFDATVETCETCGTEHKVDWQGFQSMEFAKAAITRIHRIRGMLPEKEGSDAIGD